MKTAILSVLLLTAVAAAPTASLAEDASMPSEAVIAQQFQLWNAALQTGDPAKVAALYCKPGGVLIPTLSNKIRITYPPNTDYIDDTPSEIADYFEYFLKLKPKGKIDKSYIRILGPAGAIDSGIYTFTLTTKEGKTQDVQARYTFVYDKIDGKWCIMDHHSSAMPE